MNDFYTPLIEWINTAVKYGFIKDDNANIVVEAKSVDEIVDKLQNYQLPNGRYPLDWTVQSPLGPPHDRRTNGDFTET